MLSKVIIKKVTQLSSPLPVWLKNTLVTVCFLALACLFSAILLRHTGAENNSALVFTLAVACISLLSNGYVPGIVSSVISAVAINYFFMYPFSQFTLSLTGYPVAFLSFLFIACIVSALTTRVKLQAAEAIRREQRTKALYEMNQQLMEEKKQIELEAARESIRSNILRAVSHDLRTPLTAIAGAASVLLESETRSSKNQYLVQDIKENADWLTAMVENILSVTRIQQNDMQLQKTPEVLEEVAGEALLKIRKRFPDYNIALSLPDELLMLPMESMLITQVIMNLLENAIRHSGDREHIELALARRENRAVVTVSDRGRGIPPQTLADIRQGKQLSAGQDGDASRGMGIGLSTCQSIIKAHGGNFYADNRPEGGAVFFFELPLETEGDEHVE